MNVKAWHFTDGWNLRDGRPLEIGKTYHHKEASLHEPGLHASRRLVDALAYAPGTVLSRVECSGRIVEGYKILACTRHRVVDTIDALLLIHEMACIAAEHALGYAGVKDSRCWDAIHAKRKWVAGCIDDVELSMARDAAEYAVIAAERVGRFDIQARIAAWAASTTSAATAATSAVMNAAFASVAIDDINKAWESLLSDHMTV